MLSLNTDSSVKLVIAPGRRQEKLNLITFYSAKRQHTLNLITFLKPDVMHANWKYVCVLRAQDSVASSSNYNT